MCSTAVAFTGKMDLCGRIAATLEQLAEVRDGLKNYDPAGHAPILTNDTKAGLAVNIAARLVDQLKLESSALQVNTLRRASLFGMRMDQFIFELEQLRRRIEEDLRKQYFLSVSSWPEGSDLFFFNPASGAVEVHPAHRAKVARSLTRHARRMKRSLFLFKLRLQIEYFALYLRRDSRMWHREWRKKNRKI